ncbi:hypothetical protein H6G51_17140 [Limnothrix sp. FACHB-708]|uniref:MFS transporter n=1 Tax=unclassified Limnothrix TaxID=2632864 RepID=UPI001687CCD7|nr:MULTISPECIES: hypothetical protein [unclassified Limnothrix]MBD2555011.1 hypothetical protein [Limnothrix sp. FACHB-708]MBD2591862.1 hypothetical protein [Limnothrix sp. FACHB-406]
MTQSPEPVPNPEPKEPGFAQLESNQPESHQPERNLLWRPVLGLAGLQGAISLAWVLYRFYLPQLLAAVGLPGVDRAVLILEDGLAAVLEPVIGGLSDRARLRVGSRYPLVVAGVGLTVLMFGAMVAAALGRGAIVQGLLMVTVVLWAVAMAVFRSPAIALIGQYALSSQLPQANSLLVLSAGLVGAVAPLARDRVLQLGPAYAFGLGSLALVAAAGVLQLAGPDRVLGASAVAQNSPGPIRWGEVVRLLGLGAAVGWGLRLFFGIVPAALQSQLPQWPGSVIGLGVGLTVAIGALVMGLLAGRWGNRSVMLAGAIALGMGLPMLTLPQLGIITWPLALVMMVAWAGLFNGGIPLAIDLMPDRVGLGIGCFFGGFAAVNALLSATGLPLHPGQAAGSFAVAAGWLIWSPAATGPIEPIEFIEPIKSPNSATHSVTNSVTNSEPNNPPTKGDGPLD